MQDNTIKLKDGRKLGYADYGKPDGIPLFLFHGTPGLRVFNQFENAPWIEKFNMRVITPERPGYVFFDPAPGRTILDWANDVIELADYLGIDRFNVAGGSGGGPYVLACAIHMPTRVLSATIFSSGVPPEFVDTSKNMQTDNRIIFFLAKYAPLLLRALSKNIVHTIKKHPEKFAAQMRAKSPEWDRQIMKKQKRPFDTACERDVPARRWW